MTLFLIDVFGSQSKYVNKKIITLSASLGSCHGLQSWIEQPHYQEVNPSGNLVIACKVNDKQGECRWEKDGTPVGIYPGKYEWAAKPESGDCSLKIKNASLEYDDGVWQCQVTPSSFLSKDALISEGAEVVVREPPSQIHIQRVGDEGREIIASAGEELELECIVSGGNPPAKVRWYAGNREVMTGHTQENSRISPEARTWMSISRLTLPVSKADNGAIIRCLAEHPTMETPLSAQTAITIHCKKAKSRLYRIPFPDGSPHSLSQIRRPSRSRRHRSII